MKLIPRLNRRIISLVIFMLLCLYSVACSRAGSLQIEAQIIYSMGGPQPVARQTFYLLDTDLKEVARTGGDKEIKAEDKVAVTSIAALVALLYVAESGQPFKKKAAMEAFIGSKPVWESHIVQTAETDFKGQAEFKNLTPRDYWIVGITETRSSVAIWNHKVTVKRGENKVMLDQNNALYSK
jgi:hypothetical protein